MDINALFPSEDRGKPYDSYEAYTAQLFACVDLQLTAYIERLMDLFAQGSGGFKNVLYPDIEVAHDLCRKHLEDIALRTDRGAPAADEEQAEDDDLAALFGALSDERTDDQEQVPDVEELLGYVAGRAAATDLRQVPMPLYQLCAKLDFIEFGNAATFCFGKLRVINPQNHIIPRLQVRKGKLGNIAGSILYIDDQVFFFGFGAVEGTFFQEQLTASIKITHPDCLILHVDFQYFGVESCVQHVFLFASAAEKGKRQSKQEGYYYAQHFSHSNYSFGSKICGVGR